MSLFAGLSVVEFGPGPVTATIGQFLADHGADVVRVERPGAAPPGPGEVFRHRGKQRLALDLCDAGDMAEVQRRCREADVVVVAWRPGVAERHRLDHASLAEHNPRLVHASVTGFGTAGPWRDIPGWEPLVMGKLGSLGELTMLVERQGPAYCSVPYASWAAAHAALHGVIAALIERHRRGSGQAVSTSLVQGLTAHDPWGWMLAHVAAQNPDAYTAAPPVSDDLVPSHGFAFRLLVALTADGHWLQFSQTMPHLFEAFMRALGLDWMFDDPEWAGLPDLADRDKRIAFWEHMLAAARTKTLAEWQEVFDAEPDIWAELFRRNDELLDHPQLRHIGGVVERTDPTVGTVVEPGPLVFVGPQHGDGEAPSEPDGGPEPGPGELGTAPPLEGLTIVEFGTFYAAPYGTALAADLGARVIKVETLEGEPMRWMAGFPEAGAVKSLQGKESIAVDAATPEGQRVVHQLVARADVVLQSYRAGVAQRLGIDAPTLHAINPDLVYLSSPGYGDDGPCAGRPAFAPTIGAGAGAAMRNVGSSIGDAADLSIAEIRPLSMRLGMASQAVGNADGCSAVAVGSAVLLALWAKVTGQGGRAMGTTMLSTMAHVLADDLLRYDGRPSPPMVDADLRGLGPTYRLYETARGWVFLAAPDERAQSALATALDLGIDDLTAERLGSTFATRAADEWEAALLAEGVGCVAVARQGLHATLLGPAGSAGDYVVEVDHPTFDRHRRVAPLTALSRTPAVARPSSLCGQHTRALLAEVGYDEATVDDLHERKVVRSA